MLLAHISDLHIKRPGALPYRRVDTAASLARTVARLNALVPRPDAVLVTGVPARIVWTRFCNSGGLFEGGCLTGFMG